MLIIRRHLGYRFAMWDANVTVEAYRIGATTEVALVDLA